MIFRILGTIFLLFLSLIGFVFYCMMYGEPWHDFGAWQIKRNFYNTQITHPNNSVLVAQKRYMGGRYTHGGNHCIYAVGEIRKANRLEKDIEELYKNHSVVFNDDTIPLHVLFANKSDEDYTLPFTYWQEELAKFSTQEDERYYIVYVYVERPILFWDARCDD